LWKKCKATTLKERRLANVNPPFSAFLTLQHHIKLSNLIKQTNFILLPVHIFENIAGGKYFRFKQPKKKRLVNLAKPQQTSVAFF